MKKLLDALYGIAMLLIFGAALMADGLADLPHGFLILFLIVGVAGALIRIANRLEYGNWR